MTRRGKEYKYKMSLLKNCLKVKRSNVIGILLLSKLMKIWREIDFLFGVWMCFIAVIDPDVALHCIVYVFVRVLPLSKSKKTLNYVKIVHFENLLHHQYSQWVHESRGIGNSCKFYVYPPLDNMHIGNFTKDVSSYIHHHKSDMHFCNLLRPNGRAYGHRHTANHAIICTTNTSPHNGPTITNHWTWSEFLYKVCLSLFTPEY